MLIRNGFITCRDGGYTYSYICVSKLMVYLKPVQVIMNLKS